MEKVYVYLIDISSVSLESDQVIMQAQDKRGRFFTSLYKYPLYFLVKFIT